MLRAEAHWFSGSILELKWVSVGPQFEANSAVSNMSRSRAACNLRRAYFGQYFSTKLEAWESFRTVQTKAELESTTETAGFHDSMRLDLRKQPLDNNWKIPPDNIIGPTIKLINLQRSYGESLSLGHFQEHSFINSAPSTTIDLQILLSCIASSFPASPYSSIHLLCDVSSWGGH